MLPEDDFDPVLKQVLRTSSDAAASACPDAETMAAWQARTLPAAELTAFERHAADCARCRSMLAAFVRADIVAPAVDARATASDAVPFWRRWRLTWLVPAAATATALALYVATPSLSDDRIATDDLARQVSEAARSNEATVPLEKRREAEADAVLPSGPAERRASASAARDALGVAAPSTPAEALTDNRADSRDRRAQADADATRDRQIDATLNQAETAKQAAEEPPSPAATSAFSPVPAARQDRAPAAAASAPPAAPATVGAAEALPPPAPAAGAAFADAPSLEQSARAQRRERSAELNEQVGGARRGSVARMVPWSGAPAGQRFRIDGERLERSGSGDTWSVVPLPSGVSATAIAGGTSAGQAIWLVGRGGLVLRAPEGGQFARVSSPTPVDLLSITAEDARNATVVASDGRRFTTNDGGARWTTR